MSSMPMASASSRASRSNEFSARKVADDRLDRVRDCLDYVPLSRRARGAGRRRGRSAEASIGAESRRLHYLSVPPNAALSAVRMLGEAGPGRELAHHHGKAVRHGSRERGALNAKLHEVFAEEQIFRIDHFLGKEPAQNILAFRFANGLFEPIWNRNFIDHVQIDVPETLGLGKRAGVLRIHRRLSRHGGHAPVPDPRVHGDGSADAAGAQAHQRRKEQGVPQHAADPAQDVVRGQYIGYRTEEGVEPESETETFIALKCSIDNWRWAGVPFFLRTGKRWPKASASSPSRFANRPRACSPPARASARTGPIT